MNTKSRRIILSWNHWKGFLKRVELQANFKKVVGLRDMQGRGYVNSRYILWEMEQLDQGSKM